MRALGFCLLLAIAGCNETKPIEKTATSAAATTPAAPAPAPGVTGRFVATSTTAMGITGDVTIEPGAIAFGKGQTLATTPLSAPDVTGIVGQTLYGETPPSDFTAELRRIDSVKSTDAQAQTLCGDGDQAAHHVAISRNADTGMVTLVMFSGDAAPSSAEAVCATFLYAPQ